MATFDLAILTQPISADAPCGPDLDLEGDGAYMNYMAGAEGQLPRSFFSEAVNSAGETYQRPFDRSSIDFAALFDQAAPLVKRTHDLRLIVLLAKFHVLNRELDGFRTSLEAAANLLETHWDDVHPRAEDGDYALRIIALESLNDRVPVLLPLQFLPLVSHKRHGVITFRTHLVATGQIPAGTEKVDAAAVDRAMAEVELAELVALRNDFDQTHHALSRIQKICAERIGIGQLKLDPLATLVGQIRSFLEDTIVKRDPSAAAAPQPAETPEEARAVEAEDLPAAAVMAAPAGALPNIDAAKDALAAATEYFRRFEPSNPALMLLWQAQQLVGKSFHEALQLLLPAQASKASLRVGADALFDLPLEKLAGLAPQAAAEAPDCAPAERTSAETRAQANALLELVAAFYRRTEPSSPIPLLVDRARSLSGKDFLQLVAEVLPKKA